MQLAAAELLAAPLWVSGACLPLDSSTGSPRGCGCTSGRALPRKDRQAPDRPGDVSGVRGTLFQLLKALVCHVFEPGARRG